MKAPAKLMRNALICATAWLGSMAHAAVEVGDAAPQFTLAGSDGNSHSLADLRGRHVVIAFFPKAFTRG